MSFDRHWTGFTVNDKYFDVMTEAQNDGSTVTTIDGHGHHFTAKGSCSIEQLKAAVKKELDACSSSATSRSESEQ